MDNLGRLLITGYFSAAFAGFLAAQWWGSVWAGAAVFWLGGPLAVAGLAAAPGRLGRLFRREKTEAEAGRRVALENELARWEADRLADRAEIAETNAAAG